MVASLDGLPDPYRTSGGGDSVKTEYSCGCKAVNGIVVERCAWAAETKARIDELEGNVRLVPITRTTIEYTPTGARLTDHEECEWADQAEVERLVRALSAHYPSRFTTPRPCAEVTA